MESVRKVPTFAITLYVAGDHRDAQRICREFCFDVGLCVTVTACEFIYTGGQEAGVAVGLVNYPRFPSEPDELMEKATRLAHLLSVGLCQWSALIVSPGQTVWITRRPEE